MKLRVAPTVFLFVVSVAAAVLVWPTPYAMGWAAGMLGLEVPPAGGEPQAAMRYVFELGSTWWGSVNSHPPRSGWDWVGVAGMSALAGTALLVVIAKAALFALMSAMALGAAIGVVIGRWGTSPAAWLLLKSKVLPALQAASRHWLAEIFLVVASIVSLDAIALALRVHF